MKVKVTQTHINQGCRFSTVSCPIALAAKEKFHRRVEVGLDDLGVFRSSSSVAGGSSVTYELPFKAQKFIIDFDNGKQVKPFTFEAKLID